MRQFSNFWDPRVLPWKIGRQDWSEALGGGSADAARKVLLHDEKGRICRHLVRGDHADIDGNPEWHQIMLTLDGSDGDIAWVSQL